MLTIRRATERDIPTVADLWLEAAKWLRERGYDQWQYPIKMHNIEAAINAGVCWLVEDGDVAVATVTLDANADTTLWYTEDQPDNALYLHRLVVRRNLAVRDLGSAIIDWASKRDEVSGKAWLRLDAWTTNIDLHRYYLTRGFQYVRSVKGPAVASGVLLQRPAGQVIGKGPQLTTAEG